MEPKHINCKIGDFGLSLKMKSEPNGQPYHEEVKQQEKGVRGKLLNDISNDWESQNYNWVLFAVTRFLISRTP